MKEGQHHTGILKGLYSFLLLKLLKLQCDSILSAVTCNDYVMTVDGILEIKLFSVGHIKVVVGSGKPSKISECYTKKQTS